MKIFIIVCLVATLLNQVKGTAEDPVAFYKLYNGDATNDQNGAHPLTGLDGYNFDQAVRYDGDTINKAIDLNSNDTQIKAPEGFINNITDTFFIGAWVKLVIPTSPTVQTIFGLTFQNSIEAVTMMIDYTDNNKIKTFQNFTTKDAGTLTNFNDTWVHVGLQSDGSSCQVYVNGATHGPSETCGLYLGSSYSANLGQAHNGSQVLDGSIAEFAAYNTVFYSEYYDGNVTFPAPPVVALNSKVPVAQNCPANTSEWNIGADSANRYCIHDTCAERMHDFMEFVQNNLTITTNTTGLNWEDQIDFTYTISQMDCGSGSDEECFIDECFSHGILQAEDNTDYNLTIPNPMDIVYPSETGFTLPDYHNDTNCDHGANSSTCYFVFPFFFSGIVDETAFSRDLSLIDLQFTIEYAKVPGEDTISATLVDQDFSTVTYTESNDVEANIENSAQALAGATLDFDGSAPTDIFIGDELSLVFQAPANHTERDFKNGTFEVDLVFTSNGTEVVIPVTPENVTYVNDGNVTDGADRSVEFTINANYLGTYTIRASATLESEARRRLLQVVSEERSLNSELKITVNQPKITTKQNNYLVLIISISLILIVAQNIYLRTQKSKQQKNTHQKYEQAQQDTKV